MSNTLLNEDSNWDLQKKMAKITTIELVLRYRFPEMRIGFLHYCSLEELDEIIAQISTITEQELEKYHHENKG